MIPIHTTVYYMTVKKKDSWWGVPGCNAAPWFMQRVWSTDCTLGIWLWAPEGKTTLFPLFWEMRDRLMVCEMKKMRGVKKVRKCKVKGIACWSRSQGWGLRRWGGENFGGWLLRKKHLKTQKQKIVYAPKWYSYAGCSCPMQQARCYLHDSGESRWQITNNEILNNRERKSIIRELTHRACLLSMPLLRAELNLMLGILRLTYYTHWGKYSVFIMRGYYIEIDEN